MVGKNRKQRWAQNRKGKKFGENTIRYYPICLWCGRVFCAKRPDAKTHSPTCRSALKRYVDEHGRPPLFPLGHVRKEKGWAPP